MRPRGGNRPGNGFAAAAATAAVGVLLGACSAGVPTRVAGESPGAPARLPAAAAEAAPAAALADYERAIDALRHGERVEAELQLEQMIVAYPHLPGPYVNAAILYKQDGRDADARAALEQALAIDAAHSEANNQLGILLREAGEFAAAEIAYRRALEADPNYLPALYNLGVLLDLYLQRRDEALECYEAYQLARAEPDEVVARWIIDLRRRVDSEAERVALREKS